jgi:hypothetical protein
MMKILTQKMLAVQGLSANMAGYSSLDAAIPF